MIDLSKDSNPKHYRFVDEDGTEHEVVGIKLDEDDEDGLPYYVTFKCDGVDSYWVARNGDSKGLDGTLSDVGHLIKKNSLRIYDFGSVEANPHDIQIHYEDMGDTVKLTNVVNVLSAPEMYHKFGIDWFDRHYRKSTPKVDFNYSKLFIYQGEVDYPRAKETFFEIGEVYDKAEFMRGMELVQQAAQNLSRLRKEFGSKKKTITI